MQVSIALIAFNGDWSLDSSNRILK